MKMVPPDLLEARRRLRTTQHERPLTVVEAAELRRLELELARYLDPRPDPVATYEARGAAQRAALDAEAYRLRAKVEGEERRARLPGHPAAVVRYELRARPRR